MTWIGATGVWMGTNAKIDRTKLTVFGPSISIMSDTQKCSKISRELEDQLQGFPCWRKSDFHSYFQSGFFRSLKLTKIMKL
jgi:hypothetical protein